MYLPGRTDKTIKMAGSTLDKKTWKYLPGQSDKAGRISGTVDKTTWRNLAKEFAKRPEWLVALWTSQLGEPDDAVRIAGIYAKTTMHFIQWNKRISVTYSSQT